MTKKNKNVLEGSNLVDVFEHFRETIESRQSGETVELRDKIAHALFDNMASVRGLEVSRVWDAAVYLVEVIRKSYVLFDRNQQPYKEK